MDTFAALALATDPATKASLDRKPDRKNAPLITVEMLKMILIQAAYQIIVCLVLHFAGHAILHMPYSTETDAELRSRVFNCQICERRSVLTFGFCAWLRGASC
jgi:Ca2+-transporting ATPase